MVTDQKLLGNDVIVDKEQRLGETNFSVLRKEHQKGNENIKGLCVPWRMFQPNADMGESSSALSE